MPEIRPLTRAIAAVAALTCTTSSVLAGQDSAVAESPVSTRFVLAPAVTLGDLGFDSNIFSSPDDPRGDMTASVVMRIEPSTRFGPASVRGRGAIGFAYFQQYASQRAGNADGSLRVDLPLNRFTLYGVGSALRTRDSFGPEIDVRVRRVERLLDGGGEVRVADKTWIAAGVSRSLIEFNASEVLFDSSLRQALDRTVDTMSFSARNAVTPLTTIVGRVDLQYDRFAWSPLRDANGTRVVAGFEFKPTALIAGRAHLGYRRFLSRDTTQPSVAGAIASVNVTYTWSDAVRFGMRVERDLAHSFSLEERYFVSTGMQFSVTRRMNRGWDISATARRRHLDYRGAIAPTRVVDPTDHLFGYGGGIQYRLGNTTTLDVTGEYYRRESELTGRQYDRVRLISSLEHRF